MNASVKTSVNPAISPSVTASVKPSVHPAANLLLNLAGKSDLTPVRFSNFALNHSANACENPAVIFLDSSVHPSVTTLRIPAVSPSENPATKHAV